MKILLVNRICGYFGGVEQYVADVTKGLRQKGHEVFLAFGEISEKNAEKYSELFCESFQTAEMAKEPNDKASAFAEIFSKVKPEVIFAHKVENIDFLLKYQSEIPLVAMIHDHDLCCPRHHKYFFWNRQICELPFGWHCFFDLAFLERNNCSRLKYSFKNIFFAFSEMKKYRQINTILVGSRAMQKEMLQNGFADERVLIQPPVINLPARDYTPPPDRPEILYAGQLIKGKGVDLLIDALGMVKNDFHLKVIGEGNAAPELRSMAKEKGLDNRIEFCGWIDREKLTDYYRNCRFTVVPSRWAEPFGMVGLEAMSFGRACIGFRVGGIPDWLEDGVTGFLVEPQNCRQMAEKIDILLSSHEKATTLGSNGLENFLKNFDFLQSIETLEKVFSDRIQCKGNKKRMQ
ncbi:MAG: glycosyltransferase family 4 protein [Candidatus Rifleibacteriota bacterium]